MMATRPETAEFILAHLGMPDRFSVRRMFGEYALYADGKPVAFICDDQLLVKITPESAPLERMCERSLLFPGSKEHLLVPEEMITGMRELPHLLLRMAEKLPFPKPRGKRRSA